MTWLNVLKHHRYKLGLLLLAANAAVLLNLAFGTPKAFSEWHWLDIFGEGGTALFMLFWLGLVIKSRPTGRVTNYLAYGLCFMFFSWWVDVLDEFIRLPKHIGWDHWMESAPMPVGMILLTIGLFHWHREQQAINQQMEKRERVFREHRLFDKLTPLGGAGYLKHQVSDCLAQSVEQQQPLSLLALELQQAVQSLAHKTRQQGERVYLSASTAVVMAVNEAPDELLKRLNLTLVRAKPPRSKRA